MRRVGGMVAAMLILAAGCTGGGESDGAARRATSTTAASKPLVSALPTGPCPGLGEPSADAEITFEVNNRLYAVRPNGSALRCLLALTNADWRVGPWGPAADRLVVGDDVLHLDGRRERVPMPPALLRWSRPSGTSLLGVPTTPGEGGPGAPDGRLFKWHLGTTESREITFVPRHLDALYHPAGRHIATVAPTAAGYSIVLASNTGANPKPLVRGHTAQWIHLHGFTGAGDLVFSAHHDDWFDLHVYRAGTGEVETLSSDLQGVVVVSPHSDALAFAGPESDPGRCRGGAHLTTTVLPRAGAEPRSLGSPLEARSTQAVGWLPDGSLVVKVFQHSCLGPSDVYIWRDGRARLLVQRSTWVDVRQRLPSDVPIPADVPESRAPA